MNNTNSNQNNSNNNIPVLDDKIVASQMPAENKKVVAQPMPATNTNVKPTNMSQPVQGKKIEQPLQNNNQENKGVINPNVVASVDTKATATEVKPTVVNGNQTTIQEVATPIEHTAAPVTELNTSSNKKSSNLLFFIAIIVLLLVTFFIDDVVDLLTEDNYQYVNGITPDSTSNNLVNGFIKVGENNSFMKLNKVKFYDFKQASDGTISLTYVSDKNISKPENLDIYVELYNSNQELLYKELFNPDTKVENGVVTLYSIYVTNDVYLATFYAKVVEYTKEEEKSSQTVVCTFKISNSLINLLYTNTYHFTNYKLDSYDVSKTYTSDSSNAETEKYKSVLAEEHATLEKYSITSNYTESLLTYSIDLNNYPEGYTTLYKLNTVPLTIKNKEKLKDWTCE